MSLKPVISTNSNVSNLNQINDMVRSLNKEQQTKVFKGPNNINSLITGRLPENLGYGLQFSDTNNIPRIIAYIDSNNNPFLKVSEAGVDVTTATNNQLIFNSSQNVFKINKFIKGTFPEVIVTGPSGGGYVTGTATTTIAHGLDHIPAYNAFVDFVGDGSRTNVPITFNSVLDPNLFLQVSLSIKIDATNVYLISDVFAKLGSLQVVSYEGTNVDACTVYLLQETAN